MANSLFSTPKELLDHIVTALPLSELRAAALFEAFQEHGYVARQEDVGIEVIPRGLGLTWYAALAEGSRNAPNFVKVVMLSNPAITDDAFDGWVDVVQAWSAGLPAATVTAYAREIKAKRRVDDGIPLNFLHRDIPSELLMTYRRPGDFVIVVDPAPGGRRSILTTKNIG